MYSVTTVEWPEIKKMSYSFVYSLILWREFLCWGFLISDDSNLFKIDIKLIDTYRNTYHYIINILEKQSIFIIPIFSSRMHLNRNGHFWGVERGITYLHGSTQVYLLLNVCVWGGEGPRWLKLVWGIGW